MKHYGIDKEKEKKDILDVLLDSENREPLELMDEQGRTFRFEQIAVIPYEPTRHLYAFLASLDDIPDIAKDEGIFFRVDVSEEGDATLRVEEDEEIYTKLYEVYQRLLEEAN